MSIARPTALSHIQTALESLTTGRGLTTRPSQNQMIASIASMLLDRCDDGPNSPEKGSHLMAVEAPTGTGKSFGYLLPAIPIAKAANKKIVVSTAVVSLQEQLVDKDLPAMLKAMPIPFSFAIAKGRSRFVCPSRLKSKADEMEKLGASNPDQDTSSPQDGFNVGVANTAESDALFKMRSQFEFHTWNGELETLHLAEETKKVIWPRVTTDSSGCSGKACKDYKACPYFEARKTWQAADVIVANHDLVMSDLKIGNGGSILAAPEDTIYIFDEAHHLPNKARDAWSHSFRTDTFPKMLKEIPVNMNDTGIKWSDSKCFEAKRIGGLMLSWRDGMQKQGKIMDKAQKDLEKKLQALTAKNSHKDPLVIPYTATMDELMEVCDVYLESARGIQEITSKVFNEISKTRAEMLRNGNTPAWSPLFEDVEMNRVLGAFGFYNNKFSNLIETLELFTRDQPDPSHPPVAKWLVPDDKHKAFSIHATPTMATDLLPRYLYDRAFSVIHASATITSVGGFTLYKQKTGMCYYPNSRMLKLDSPFDFKKNAVLAFGDLGVNPSEAEKHTTRLVETLPVIFDEKKDLGTLVLFASKSQLEQVAARLPHHYRAMCKVQYEAPNASLIEAHKKDVDAGKRSILMGTQSFSEGLDLPGAWCSHVISTKLPFSMPDNPIDKTLSAWMESQGRNVFREIAVPEASERVTQQAGRLLRRESDTGQFTVLDNRLMTKWNAYGKAIVEALPPFGRTRWNLTRTVYKGANPPAKQPVAPSPPANVPKGLPELTTYDATSFTDIMDDTPF